MLKIAKKVIKKHTKLEVSSLQQFPPTAKQLRLNIIDII